MRPDTQCLAESITAGRTLVRVTSSRIVRTNVANELKSLAQTICEYLLACVQLAFVKDSAFLKTRFGDFGGLGKDAEITVRLHYLAFGGDTPIHPDSPDGSR